jgi:hypothetical protein
MTLASTHEEAEGFAQRVALLKGELVEERLAQDTTEENSRGFSDIAAKVERW